MSLLHLISNFPAGFFARNLLRFSSPARAAFWIHGSDSVSGVLMDGKSLTFDADLQRYAGAPLLLSPLAAKTPFEKQILAPYRLSRDAHFVFVVDQPGAIVSLVQTRKLGLENVVQLRSTPVEALLPMSAPPDAFSWEILTAGMEALPEAGPVPESVIVVGLPKKLCWWAEKWVESLDGILLSVLPSLLAELWWCRAQGSPFVLLPGVPQSYLALFQNEKLQLLTRLPAAHLLFGSIVEPLVEEFRAEMQINAGPLAVYPGSLSPNQFQSLLSRFKVPTVVLNPPGNHPRGSGAPAEASVLVTALEAAS
jgi:hypothetical protein